MGDTHLIIFICLAIPLSMMLCVFRDRARVLLGFLLVGIFMGLFAGQINGFIRNQTGLSVRFLTVNITPIVEEILKAIPIVFITFLIRPDSRFLLECSISVGVGFATMENVCLLFDASSMLSAGEIIARGFGAGMMHGVSTLAVGYSMVFAGRDRKFSYTGTIAALSVAVIYHSIYNVLVQSEYPLLGILLPLLSFVPLLFVLNHKRIYPQRN